MLAKHKGESLGITAVRKDGELSEMRKGEVNYKRLKSFLDILESILDDEKRDEALELLLSDSSNPTHFVPHEKKSRQKYNVEMESIDIEFT